MAVAALGLEVDCDDADSDSDSDSAFGSDEDYLYTIPDIASVNISDCPNESLMEELDLLKIF